MGTETVPADPNPWRKWLLPVVLAVIIIAVLAGAFLATHPHVFGSNATDTPTLTPTAPPTRTPKPTATTKVVTKVITATPRPTATETPQPTFTATPSATPTPTGPPTGAITYPKTQLDQWQRGANQNNPSYTLDRNVYKAMRVQLSGLGYKGQVTVVSPPEPPSPTPTPFTGPTGLPQVKITIEWQGKRYGVVMTQPDQQGPSGIWAISHITLM